MRTGVLHSLPWIVQTVILSGLALVFGTLGVGAVAGAWDFGLTAGAEQVGLLLVADGLLLAAAALFAGRGRLLVDLPAVGVVLGNAGASVADDVGPADLATLLLCLVTAALIVVNSRFARRRAKASQVTSDQ
ncbi:hypothetical protein [Microbacterium thalassium]|uniref:Uncharacterized protein n=1 Tax=Microbacterium thalassium TaxID=362649 RepID=A0A7X0FMG6_9MICO|nr:hypothetical protein [Microbacterium thalassium]MBB6390171.1 hypothetical protein [Microbacterium thalassium]GLK25279.1 hypothetical protein GCM10017607_25980 [Microbacterium thalassium]